MAECFGCCLCLRSAFLALSLTSFRRWVIESIPTDLRRAISAGIGAFLAFIGLKQMGVIVANDATFVALGNFLDPNVLLGVFGIFIVALLSVKKVRGAFIIGIIITSIIGWAFRLGELPEGVFSAPASIAPIAFELDILSALTLSLIPVILTFMITDMFDSLGTLSGVGFRAGMFQGEGNRELQKTLEVDAAATVGGSLLGVSTTTAFIESASGVEEGGRTGLTAVFTGLFFVLTLFMLPLFKAIPPNAIYPVLVFVGVLMFSELGKIDYSDYALLVPSFFIVLLMPLTFSITNGLAAGFIVYLFLRLIKGEFSKINRGLVLLALISFIPFIFSH